MVRFVHETGYRIHKTFAVHANEKRENVDFAALMENTKIDRKFW